MTNKISQIKDKKYLKELREKDSVIYDGEIRKEYTAQERKVKVEKGEKKLELKLISSTSLMVQAGECVKIAELEIVNFTGKTHLFDSIEFIDKKKWKSLNKNFVYKYAPLKTVKIELPELEELSEDKRFIEKEVGDWDKAVEFSKLSELPKEKVRIGVFTDTTLGEKNEWIPNIMGVDVSEWADYDVTALNAISHDTTYANKNSLVMIDSTHFMLAYEGNGFDGYIKTFSIDGSYNITEIDSLEYDTNNGRDPSLAKIDATHFILAYKGTDNDGFIKTFSIDGSYDNITEIDSLEHDTVANSYNSLVAIDSTHFILAYTGDGSDGFIKTFSVDGSFDITEIDSLEHDTNYAIHNSLIKIDSTHFMLAYSAGLNGYLKTFSIDGSHNITEIADLTHTTTRGTENSLAMIDSTHFILAYQGADYDGYIATFSIDGSYENITEIDSLEHDTTDGAEHSLVAIDSTHFILAYKGTDSDGFVKTFTIDGSYDITETDSLEHDTDGGLHNSLVKIDDSHFILAYSYPAFDNYGRLKTFSVEIPSTGTNFQINISDSFKEVSAMKININDEWKSVAAVKINVGDSWKSVF